MKTLFSIFMGLGEHHLFKNDTIDSVFLQFFRNFSELSFWEHLQTDYMFWIREAALQSWFLEKGVLKIWCKFTGAQPCRRNQTSVWAFCYKLASYFQNTFDQEHLWVVSSGIISSSTLIHSHSIFNIISMAQSRSF